jgi:hypothetical protein
MGKGRNKPIKRMVILNKLLALHLSKITVGLYLLIFNIPILVNGQSKLLSQEEFEIIKKGFDYINIANRYGLELPPYRPLHPDSFHLEGIGSMTLQEFIDNRAYLDGFEPSKEELAQEFESEKKSYFTALDRYMNWDSAQFIADSLFYLNYQKDTPFRYFLMDTLLLDPQNSVFEPFNKKDLLTFCDYGRNYLKDSIMYAIIDILLTKSYPDSAVRLAESFSYTDYYKQFQVISNPKQAKNRKSIIHIKFSRVVINKDQTMAGYKVHLNFDQNSMDVIVVLEKKPEGWFFYEWFRNF